MENKITYLLNHYLNIEWSGPCWYSYKKDEDGFPTEFKLEHFVLLDKGTASATDWSGEQFGKIFPIIMKKYPKLKKCVVGNIHSHHTMGAFFSGTDIEHLEENANKDFYPSLVVARSGKALKAFAFSYKDQYNNIHRYEVDEDDIAVKIPKPEKEWLREIKEAEKVSKPEAITLASNNRGYYNAFNRNHNQSYLFNYHQNGWGEKVLDETDPKTWTDEEKVEAWQEVMDDIEMGFQDTIEAKKRLKEIGVSWEGVIVGNK